MSSKYSQETQTVATANVELYDDHHHDHEDHLVRVSVGLLGTLCSLILFQFIISRLIPFVIQPPKHITNVIDGTEKVNMVYWKWLNLWISWVHALICAIWVMTNVLGQPDFMSELISWRSYSEYMVICFSTGYFTYDFLEMMRQGLLGKCWELTAHHVAITTIMIWNLYDCQRIGWNIIALTAEINTFFLHSRKLLRMHGVHSSKTIYKLNMFMNFLSFIIFRFGSSWAIIIGTCIEYRRVSQAYLFSLCSMQFVMNVINPVLFWRLLQSDILYPRKELQKSNGHSTDIRTQNGSTLVNGHRKQE